MEDTQASLKLLTGILRENGYGVRPASSGPLALRSVAVELPDLILLDVRMPDMTGYEVCRRLKADKRTKRIPVIFISALEETGDKVKAFDVGGVDYITKPFESREVLARVRTHLDMRSLQIQLERSYEEMEERVRQRTAELRETNAALVASEKELALRNRLAEIFLTVSDQEVYPEILKIVLDALESEYGIFGYIENGALVCPSMTMSINDQCQMTDTNIVFQPEDWSGMWGRAMIEKKTLYSNEPFQVPEGHVPIFRAIDVPIVHHGELIGNLAVGNKATDYSETDVKLLESIAAYVAPVLSARLERDQYTRARELAEKELSRHAAELSVANRELRMKQAELEEFIYTVSHDLKAPVVSISGLTGMIEEKMSVTLNGQVTKYLDRIRYNSHIMEGLIADLLDLTRIGRTEESEESLDFARIVHEVLESFLDAANEKGIELVKAGPFPGVIGCPNRIRQLVSNLVDNAIKYVMPPHGARVEVGFDSEADPAGGAGAFYVRDNGQGIDPEFHERIFGMFQRLQVDGQQNDGSGVGLAIVKRIVEKHGGSVWLASEPGCGSTFYFTLPLSDSAENEAVDPVLSRSEDSNS